MTDMESSPTSDIIWYPLEDGSSKEAEGPQLIIFNVKQSALRKRPTDFSLAQVVRQYCNERISPPVTKGGPSVIKVEMFRLYDILGLLRALQYDITAYNKTDPTDRYGCFRLVKQAAAFNIHLDGKTKSNGRAISIPGLDSLVKHIETTFCDLIQPAQDTIAQGRVDFDSLQEYYKPGVELVDCGLLSGMYGVPMLVLCRSSYYKRGKTATGKVVRSFNCALEFVISVGANLFAVVEGQLFQSEFEGTRSFLGMSGDICTQPTDSQLTALKDRGAVYQRVCMNSKQGSGNLVNYKAGTFWTCGKSKSTGASRQEGRMVVDTYEAWTRGVHCAKAPADGAAGDAVTEAIRTYARLLRQNTSAANGEDPFGDGESNSECLFLRGPLHPSLSLRTWPVVCGFSLPSRSWGLALVDGISPVEFVESAFDRLVIPAARKRLLRALVTSHGVSDGGVDVLPGKGEGLMFLLHGPPGCGKTLTSEAVAEVLHRPLYKVSMGELGTTPESLEERLQDIFDLCLPWQALVLIDEAELLLESRKASGDLVRNAMVCVMLRLLEYYPGILFLTTNSGLESLDPAIASRLTCILHYESLDANGLVEIWKASLDRARENDSVDMDAVDDSDLRDLATDYDGINGRQIKNTVQLATALCQYEKVPLSTEILRETLGLTAVKRI